MRDTSIGMSLVNILKEPGDPDILADGIDDLQNQEPDDEG